MLYSVTVFIRLRNICSNFKKCKPLELYLFSLDYTFIFSDSSFSTCRCLFHSIKLILIFQQNNLGQWIFIITLYHLIDNCLLFYSSHSANIGHNKAFSGHSIIRGVCRKHVYRSKTEREKVCDVLANHTKSTALVVVVVCLWLMTSQ